jgi:hypothetical protein
MSLALTKLENARRLANGRIRARCPACAANGHDNAGEHLIIEVDGRFGCAVHPRDREHRKQIWALAGDRTAKPVLVRTLGRFGREAKKASQPLVLQRNILGRLGRGDQSHAGATVAARRCQQPLMAHAATVRLDDFSDCVPGVPNKVLPSDEAAWLPIARQVLAGEFDDADHSTLESLAIGLCGIAHPLCRSAFARLKPHLPKPSTL